jgi:DNA polymerase III subunit epsilon
MLKIEAAEEISSKINRPLVVYDLETTEIDAKVAEIVQFCAIKMYPDGTQDKLQFLCKPSRPISKGASEVHGHTAESVAKCKPFATYAADIESFFVDSVISGFNIARYDNVILKRQMKESGFPDFMTSEDVYDAYVIYVNHSRRRLADAYKFYTGNEFSEDDAHDAFEDVKATIAVIGGQLNVEKTDIDKIIDTYNNKGSDKDSGYGNLVKNVDGKPTLNFGKHKGETLEDVDRSYLDWIIVKSELPDQLKKLIKEFLHANNKRNSKKVS